LHLSDISQREDFRKVSFVEKASFAQIMGHGPDGYPMAIEATVQYLSS